MTALHDEPHLSLKYLQEQAEDNPLNESMKSVSTYGVLHSLKGQEQD